MDHTRKMWASAAVVGVIVVGGASVAAAASAGKLDQVARETRAQIEKTGEQPRPETTDGVVVSTEVNPDPREVLRYWSDQRMEDAQPMPMPEVGRLETSDAAPGGRRSGEVESGEIAGLPE